MKPSLTIVLRALFVSVAMACAGAAYAQDHAGGSDETCTDTPPIVSGVYTKATWPCELTKRPVSLAKGMTEIRLNASFNLTTDQVGKPFTITPAAYFGVSDKLSIGINNDTLCLSGMTGGCAKTFNSLGIDAVFALTQGDTNIGLHGGLSFSSLDPNETVLNAGLLGRLTFGQLAVILDPRLEIGLNHRAEGNIKESLAVPVALWFQASSKLAVGIDTGISLPDLGHTGDFYAVPLGIDALFAVSNKLDVGGRFVFDELLGKPKPAGAAEARSLMLLVNFRL